MDKVVFLDRDGTINVEKNYLYRIEDFQFINGTIDAVRMLNRSDYKVVIVTNQAGIARGLYSEDDVKKLHQHINNELGKHNAHIDYFYYCPHHPNGINDYKTICNCRKPNIGMFLNAEKIIKIDKKNSWMIGDNINDILAGNNYNIKSILVATGYGSEVYEKFGHEIQMDYYARDVLDAVNFILKCKE